MSPLAAARPATETVEAAPAAAPPVQKLKRELRLVQAAYSGGAGGVTGVVVFADEDPRGR
ncbi:hypothetical protein [Zavarzinia compransoris]|uniref:Uncharacterized protein n=1 Tax=Zavarzinia compransoris TaxID=1264899 RepID=A0A317EBY9_9PROT|nr:hypothetical protein [Zavarzinia compransoris]PWR23620.1 hypothetical protein DKG75_03375 [Zavarzinia compransoris]TDP47838.1 hypothetical protein DES42_102134 [Zavarzinia compransoris]